jgi:hypothetical protein
MVQRMYLPPGWPETKDLLRMCQGMNQDEAIEAAGFKTCLLECGQKMRKIAPTGKQLEIV